MNVAQQYAKLLGIPVQPDTSREEIVGQVLTELAARQDLHDCDLQFLEMVEVEDGSPIALWLANNRQPVEFEAEAQIRVHFITFYLANLTDDKGEASLRVEEMMAKGMKGPQIAKELRNLGYSINEVKAALQNHLYKVEMDMVGGDEPDTMFPVLLISHQPRTKNGWEFWKREKNDVSRAQVDWTLPPEDILRLGLPVMEVNLVESFEVLTLEIESK